MGDPRGGLLLTPAPPETATPRPPAHRRQTHHAPTCYHPSSHSIPLLDLTQDFKHNAIDDIAARGRKIRQN
jgi:hypothetical protein